MANKEIGYIDKKEVGTMLEKLWRQSMKERNGFNTWDEKFTKPIIKSYKISICTTVMNRMGDLKRTLIHNMKSNVDYKNIEYVILDYNSTDGLEEWMFTNLKKFIDAGIIMYLKTTEPQYYDMSHSRNVAFLAATGDIVNNVDADNYTLEGFATYINKMANEQPTKALFAKSRQKLRGRLGFFKSDFIHLGGYDENLKGYGHDDGDLFNRACEMGFRLMPFRQYFAQVDDHKKHQEGNYEKEWWDTEGRNRMITFTNLICKEFIANKGKTWGKANLIKNFKDPITTGVMSS